MYKKISLVHHLLIVEFVCVPMENKGMADQERTVKGYPVQIVGYSQAPPTTTRSSTNPNATYTLKTPPITTQNRPTTTITAATTTPNDKNKCQLLLYTTVATVLTVLICYVCVIYSFPQLYPPKFQVNSVTVYPFNISSSHITANWNFNLSITNPNDEFIFYYYDSCVSVFYKEKNISSTTIEPFLQDNGNTRLVQATIAASSAYVNDDSIASAIAVDLSDGIVSFDVIVNATTRIKPGTHDEVRKQMSVSCVDVKVVFPSNTTTGILLDGSMDCNVSLHKLQ